MPAIFKRRLGYAWGALTPAFCTLLVWPLRERLGTSSLLVVYLLGVFLVAARQGRGASFLASLLSAAAFAYFLAPPIFSLAVADSENIIGLGAMLIVAHVTSSLMERLRSQSEQAREASVRAEGEALRNALLSAVSHDLRTPLTRIIGAASLLVEREENLDPEERGEFSKAILEEAERMADLMDKILNMARITTGTIAPQCEWNAIEEVVGGTLARLDKALQDRPVSIRLPDDLPLVWVDAVLIQQVLTNLIENAVKYTPPGGPIDISARAWPSALRLAVADCGPGIPPGSEERLFEKFYRLEIESPQTGVGLGLSLCRAIAEAHGGGLTAGNRPGGGAVFTLSLPLREPPAMLKEEEAE